MYGINKDLKIHFIGVGGIGMSGIAEILINMGYQVSGSDLSENANTMKLKGLGATIYKDHHEKNIEDVQLVVYSSAINEKNPEVVKSKENNIPIIKRAEMLAELMRLKFGIAIAGSHGKTTTSSFVSTILKEASLRPTCIIGGIVKNLGGHALNGDGEYLVAEADESDGSFLFLNPIMSVITNIDNDHLDYYGTVEKLESAFEEFSNKVPFYGRVIINLDDKKSSELLNRIRRQYKTFSIGNFAADYVAKNINHTDFGCSFDLEFEKVTYPCEISLSGEHNVRNALAAIAVAHQLKLPLDIITEKIRYFVGVGRRFEILSKVKDMVIVDDYGHHPTELKATIETAKKKYPSKEVIAIFEPHRFSRTKEHWEDFVDSFEDVTKLYLAPIYPASEKPIEGITSEVLLEDINKKFNNAEPLNSWNELIDLFSKYEDKDCVILSMGAGSISNQTRVKLQEWNPIQ